MIFVHRRKSRRPTGKLRLGYPSDRHCIMFVILINETLRTSHLPSCKRYTIGMRCLTVRPSVSLQWIKSKSFECFGSACQLITLPVRWYIYSYQAGVVEKGDWARSLSSRLWLRRFLVLFPRPVRLSESNTYLSNDTEVRGFYTCLPKLS